MTSDDVLAKFGLVVDERTSMPVGVPAPPHWRPCAPGALGDDRVAFAGWLAEWGLTRGAEIGTCGGEFAEVLLQHGATLTCVDPWVVYPEYPDYRRQRTLDKAYAAACARLAPYYGRCNVVKKTSLEAAREIRDGSLDFVYVDANHQLQFVLDDIRAWEPKVRSGGIVSGHDYARSKIHQVKEAVDSYTAERRIRPWFALGWTENDYTRSWFWVKP